VHEIAQDQLRSDRPIVETNVGRMAQVLVAGNKVIVYGSRVMKDRSKRVRSEREQDQREAPCFPFCILQYSHSVSNQDVIFFLGSLNQMIKRFTACHHGQASKNLRDDNHKQSDKHNDLTASYPWSEPKASPKFHP
jgi:hypothetical protein